MRMNWMTTAVVMTLAACGTAMAQVADDAKAVLTESAKALRSVEGVEFKVKKYGTGMLKDIIDSDGTVKLWRPKGATSATWMVEGRVKQPGKSDKKLAIVNDGTKVMWLSYDDNTMYERATTDAQASQEVALASQILLPEWTMATPFQKEMTQFAKLQKLGIDNVNGEVCDIIEAQPADGSRNFTWAISVADKLPRRIEMGTGTSENKIAMITEMSAVKPATFTTKDFDLAMPAGFVKSPMPVTQSPVPAPTQTPMPPVELGLKPGTPAPAFSAKDASGAELSAESLKGKVVVMEFWGTMFKSSTANAADMKSLAGEVGDGAKFVSFACRELDQNRAKDFWTKNGMSYTLVPSGDDVAKNYKISGYPSYYVIGKDGNVAAFFQDFPGKDKLKAAIDAASK